MTPFLAIAALAALIYQIAIAPRPEGRQDWAGSAVKTTATAALAAHGFASDAPALISLGLACGALGDFALSRPGKAMFLAGMAAFAAGHLAYVGAFWGWRGPDASLMQITALAGLAGLILSTELWLAPRAGDLRAPVRGYAILIGVMAALAILLPPGSTAVVSGAALFVLSDSLLALRLFVLRGPIARRGLALAVWPAYWGGQVLILRGAAVFG